MWKILVMLVYGNTMSEYMRYIINNISCLSIASKSEMRILNCMVPYHLDIHLKAKFYAVAKPVRPPCSGHVGVN